MANFSESVPPRHAADRKPLSFALAWNPSLGGALAYDMKGCGFEIDALFKYIHDTLGFFNMYLFVCRS